MTANVSKIILTTTLDSRDLVYAKVDNQIIVTYNRAALLQLQLEYSAHDATIWLLAAPILKNNDKCLVCLAVADQCKLGYELHDNQSIDLKAYVAEPIITLPG